MKEKQVPLTFFNTFFSVFRSFFIMFEMWSGGVISIDHTIMALQYLHVCNSDTGIFNKLLIAFFFVRMCSLGDSFLHGLAVEY